MRERITGALFRKEKMKYKLLIAGKNSMVIDELFDHMDNMDLCLITTSLRYRDMLNHIQEFKPDMFIYCVYNESVNEYKSLMEYKRRFSREGIPVCVIGSKEDCDELRENTGGMAELELIKPITASRIRSEIVEYLEQLASIEEENKRLREELEKKLQEDRRRHILVIDDDPRQLNIVKEYLYENYEIATAISGKIAYRFLEKKKTDLILLDYEMPGETGPEVLVKLREMGVIDGVPVLFLTGATDKERIKTALMLKPQGYLLKPIDKEKLLGTIEKYLSKGTL